MFVKKLAILNDLETGAELKTPLQWENVSVYTKLRNDSYGKPQMPPTLFVSQGHGTGKGFYIDHPVSEYMAGGILVTGTTETFYIRDQKLTKHVIGVRVYLETNPEK